MAKGKSNSKETETVKKSVTFSPQVTTPISDDTIYEVLNKVVFGDSALINVKEIAAIFNKKESTVYKYISGEIKMSLEQFATLVRELASRGDFSPIDLMIPDEFVLMPVDNADLNGSLDDELGEITEFLGEARHASNSGRDAKAKLAVHNAKKTIFRLEREIRERSKAQ